MRNAYEYHVMPVVISDAAKTLNELATKGWRLISTSPHSVEGKVYLYLGRSEPDKQPRWDGPYSHYGNDE